MKTIKRNNQTKAVMSEIMGNFFIAGANQKGSIPDAQVRISAEENSKKAEIARLKWVKLTDAGNLEDYWNPQY